MPKLVKRTPEPSTNGHAHKAVQVASLIFATVHAPSSQEKVRAERLAVNVIDLDRVEDGMVFRIAKSTVHSPIHVDKNEKDEVAVEFSCPLLEACLMCDLVRSADRKAGREVTRVYLNKHGTWVKVPEKAMLTMKLPGRASMLSPKVFADAVELVQGPPPSRSVDLSKVRSIGG